MANNINGYTPIFSPNPIRRIGDQARQTVFEADMAHRQKIKDILQRAKVGVIFGLAAAGVGAIMIYASPGIAAVVIIGKILLALGTISFVSYLYKGGSTLFNEYRNKEPIDVEAQDRQSLSDYRSAFGQITTTSNHLVLSDGVPAVPSIKDYNDLLQKTLEKFNLANKNRRSGTTHTPLPRPEMLSSLLKQ